MMLTNVNSMLTTSPSSWRRVARWAFLSALVCAECIGADYSCPIRSESSRDWKQDIEHRPHRLDRLLKGVRRRRAPRSHWGQKSERQTPYILSIKNPCDL